MAQTDTSKIPSLPGIDAESLFVGTVLHSLDHTLMGWHCEDPLWLDIDHPRFGPMASVGRVVRAGFVEALPSLFFERHMRGSNHPFFKAVYNRAAKIDKLYADHMDTCIIK